jgi:hypothetical protein
MSHEPGAGGTPEWYTPPELFAALGLEFDLDPCAPPLPAASWIPARTRFSLSGETVLSGPRQQIVQDGLAAPWRGRVWLNPPYATRTAAWIGRLVQHGDGIATTFVRTDTLWWQWAAAAADAVCFVYGRVEFVPGDLRFRRRSRSGAASCLLAFGEECAAALRRSGLGVCAELTAVDRLTLAV